MSGADGNAPSAPKGDPAAPGPGTELIDALGRPGAYPFAVDRVEVRQTHISMLFFAGDRVFKVKKPLDLGFLDFTTRQRRRHFCHEEVRLNRRLAPDVYVGVCDVVRDPDGTVRLTREGRAGAEAEVIDHAVEMHRLPEHRMLDRLLEAGAIDNRILDRLADLLLRFHRAAATGPGVDEHGAPDAVAAAILGNLADAAGHAGDTDRGATLSSALHGHLERRLRARLENLRPLLERRVREGWIRDGHGDLHAGNICLAGDEIVIYDCIEFSAALRCGDTVRDVAFLVMDLDARGYRAFGAYLARRYATAGGDDDFAALLPLYTTHLACVRGRVNSLGAADTALAPPRRAEARRAAMHYFHLAAAYGLPPVLLVMCGLPGTGKSRAAAQLARPLDAAVIRSDVVRKRLAGVPPAEHPTGAAAERLYAAPMSRRTYATMREEAAAWLEQGRSVVVDATFPHRRARREFTDLARSGRLPFAVVHVTCPEEVVARRMADRARAPREVSDADWAVYRRFRSRFEAPTEIEPPHLVEVDGDGAEEDGAARVMDALIAQGDPPE